MSEQQPLPGFQTFLLYQAIALHFNERNTYDFVKYNGKTRIKQDSFIHNKQKYVFSALEREYSKDQLIGMFFVALRDRSYLPKIVVKVLDTAYQKELDKWVSYINNQLLTDIKALIKLLEDSNLTLNDLYAKGEGTYPLVYQAYLDAFINFEFIELIDALVTPINKDMSNDIISFPTIAKQLERSRWFLRHYVLSANDINKVTKQFSNLVAHFKEK